MVSQVMKSFNVLDRDQKIHCNAILEASAGTGKTFAIENVVVRFLIDPEKDDELYRLEDILVVTFTRAATRDLKLRIRAKLEKAAKEFKAYLADGTVAEGCADYLIAHMEMGAEAVSSALRHVERALFSFDQAQIYTIHGFCWRMLRSFAIEAGVSMETSCSEEEPLSKTKLLQVIKDFLRTELIDEVYSPQQLKIVLKKCDQRIETLQTELLKAISKGLDISATPSFSEYLNEFRSMMRVLKGRFGYISERIVSDFLLHAPAYRGLSNRSKQIHQEVMDKVIRFAKIFDKEQWAVADFEMLIADGLYLVDALSPENLAARGMPPSREKLHYPDLLETLRSYLGNIVSKARDGNCIFARMASDCQRLMKHYLNQEELLGFDDLLQQMRRAIYHPSFADKIRGCFRVVIVDEFQDTDPVQWEIFKILFTDQSGWNGYVYLVGDPKQSIYAFRQADIYTYLSAAQTLGNQTMSTLDTNFRSQYRLVEALNALFSAAQELFPLPREKTNLTYRKVAAGKEGDRHFSDGKGCVQFLMARGKEKRMTLVEYEKGYFFPAIAQEIVRLNTEDGIRLNECAVLVSDRFQAERLTSYLKSLQIPAISQRGNNLADSPAVHAMRELLNGILHYRTMSALRVALAGRMIGMTYLELLTILQENRWEQIVERCDRLRHLLLNDSFAVFYGQLMRSSWHLDGMNMLQRLLGQEGGLEFYREWQDIAEVLIQEQMQHHLSPEGLIAFLDEFDKLAMNDDDRMKLTVDPSEEGVTILTTHVSKGLEFDVVFSLGLIKRSPINESLMPIKHDHQIFLEPIFDKSSPRYVGYCQEIDAEKMRQLYVAFTRAKYRLYVPVAIACGGSDIEYGEASPMDLFLARLGNDTMDADHQSYEGLYAKIREYNGSSLEEDIEKAAVDIGLTILDKSKLDVVRNKSSEATILMPPDNIVVPGAPIYVQSFTSLAHVKKSYNPITKDELLAPHDLNAEHRTPHTLPAGSDVGTVFHNILETIPFHTVDNIATVLSAVQTALQGTQYMGWNEVIAGIVFRALRTHLPGSAVPFCLADVDPKKIYREIEFLYSETGETGNHDGFVKGVIDLFFEHQGKYYLLDWKSNWLGTSDECYLQDNLMRSMEDHDYHLQAKIYREALKRYLRLFDQRDFDELFGGTYYIFLRGLGAGNGILYMPSQITEAARCME